MQIPDRLYPDRIKDNLKTNRIGKKVLVFDSVLTTSRVAAEYAKNQGNDGFMNNEWTY